MKVSRKLMKELGFNNYGNSWVHGDFSDLRFDKLPRWDEIVHRSFRSGSNYGKGQAQEEIKEALGIY